MRIGTVLERKDGEARVGLTPEGAFALTSAGNEVWFERGSGVGSGAADAAYEKAGGRAESAEEVWANCDLVVKVKEPVESEYGYLRSGLGLFTYLHLAAERELTERLLASGCTSMAYELVRTANGYLPLLAPMSQVAGRMAAEIGGSVLDTAVRRELASGRDQSGLLCPV